MEVGDGDNILPVAMVRQIERHRSFPEVFRQKKCSRWFPKCYLPTFSPLIPKLCSVNPIPVGHGFCSESEQPYQNRVKSEH